MIFILNEEVLNGTVTMSIHSKGIEAETFEEAVEKLKRSFTEKIIIHENYDNNYSFNFSVIQPDPTSFQVVGRMENKPLEII